MANFWNSAELEPKKSYQYTVTFGTVADSYLIKSAKLPTMAISSIEANYTQYKFYYPGKVTWSPVSFTIYDIVGEGSVSHKIMALLENAGLAQPENANVQSTLSKKQLSQAVGDVIISQIDTDGNKIGSWTLQNAFITNMDFGQHDYSAEGLIEVSIELQYDWANYAQ